MIHHLKSVAMTCCIFFCLSSAKAQLAISSHPAPAGVTITTARMNAISIDAMNNKWIAFANYGIGIYDGANWTMMNASNSGLPDDSVTSIDFDGTGNSWIGTKAGAVYKSGTNYTVYNSGNSGLPSNIITCVFSDGILTWFGTYNGLVSYDGSNWMTYNISNSSITNDSITVVIKDNTGNLWVGTRNGLSEFDGSAWNNYTTTNSDLSPYIFDIEEDADGKIWISSGVLGFMQSFITHGIFYIDDSSPELFSVNVYDYDVALSFQNGVNFSRDSNGRVYFRANINSFSGMIKIENGFEFYETVGIFGGVAIFGNIFEFDNNDLLWTIYRNRFYFFSLDFSGYQEPHLNLITHRNHRTLDVNKVKAGINVAGDMHWDGANPKYEVPKGSGKHSVYASALWIGGLDAGGELHLAAHTYRQTGIDFWAGPVDEISIPFDTVSCKQFNRIWKMHKWKIEEYKSNFLAGNVANGSYQVPEEIQSWPARGNGIITGALAPFIDTNVDGLYDPMDGDYPDIKGDQMLYYIFNDSLGIHQETDGEKLGLEVHVSAYAYNCSGITDTMSVLNTTTFYHYEIINRSNTDYDSIFVGLWSDMDLGNAIDDFVGCDTILGAGFTYNGDNDDETASGYGLNPPMQNIKILRGMLADPGDGIDNNLDGIIDETGERTTMNHFQYYYNSSGGPIGNPSGAMDFYNYMRSRWLDGSQVVDDQGNPTNFMFPGVPFSGTGWSEPGSSGPPGDRRFIMSSGPVSLDAGDTITIDFAYVFTHDSLNPNGVTTSIARNTADLQRVQNWFESNSFPSCEVYSVGLDEDNVASVYAIYPNPSSTFLFVGNSIFEPSDLEYTIYSILGSKISSGNVIEGKIDISRLKANQYILKIDDSGQSKFHRFIKL